MGTINTPTNRRRNANLAPVFVRNVKDLDLTNVPPAKHQSYSRKETVLQAAQTDGLPLRIIVARNVIDPV